jgi:phage-related tail protein
VGTDVAPALGVAVGTVVLGLAEGANDGDAVGIADGDAVGLAVGPLLGVADGTALGSAVGATLEGATLGIAVGAFVGNVIGACVVGPAVGFVVGSAVWPAALPNMMARHAKKTTHRRGAKFFVVNMTVQQKRESTLDSQQSKPALARNHIKICGSRHHKIRT